MYFHGGLIMFCLLVSWTRQIQCVNVTNEREERTTESTLEKLVKMFSQPGAFEKVEEIFGENTIETLENKCPNGEEGLDCRRAEARRSSDCPNGDCYCYSCAMAGPVMWASCCRESSKCCSHLAAACRNCDHPTLIPFCSKHFKKCLSEVNHGTTSESSQQVPQDP